MIYSGGLQFSIWLHDHIGTSHFVLLPILSLRHFLVWTHAFLFWQSMHAKIINFFIYIYSLSLKARVVAARYVMKCDDDTFVRLDSVMAEIKKVPDGKSFYMGNMNYYHRPLREGKWAVSYEVKWTTAFFSCFCKSHRQMLSWNYTDWLLASLFTQVIKSN